MKRNTCKGENTKTKLVYKFRIEDAQLFDFELSKFKEKYNALYKQTTKKG